MKLYTIQFRVIEKKYNPERVVAIKKIKGNELEIIIPPGGLTVLESELKKYWDYGGGPQTISFAGEIDDSYFHPVLSESEFIENEIKSKKSGEVIGYQG